MDKRDLVAIGSVALLVPLVCCGCCLCAVLLSSMLPVSEDGALDTFTLATRTSTLTPFSSTKQSTETPSDVKEKPTGQPTETALPPTTSVEAHTATSAVTTISPIASATETLSPSTTVTRESGLIPGIRPDDVLVYLLERGFDCSDQYQGVLYISTMCTIEEDDYLFVVEYYGRTQDMVDFVEGAVIHYGFADDGISAELLGFLAAIPHDGAVPETARLWVEQSLPTLTEDGMVSEEQIGSVKFRLFGPPTARTLEIGDLP